MMDSIRLTKNQQRRFYRQAVEQTLVILYGQPQTKSREIVDAWWKRVSHTEEFRSDLLFHVEPLHAAADIAQLQSLAITTENESVYRSILEASRKRALQKQNPLQTNLLHRKMLGRAQPTVKKRIKEQKLLAHIQGA